MFTKHYAHHEICSSSSQNAAPATEAALQGSQSAAPATKFAPQASHHAALPSLPKRSFRMLSPDTSPNSENEPLVQSLGFTTPATKSERAEDHSHVKSTAPATKSAH